MGRWLAAFAAVVGLFSYNAAALANETQGIAILSGSFGKLGGAHRLDISARLQDLCGARGTSCDVFCSQTSFGGRSLGKHSVCRVIYRCPDGVTRSAEAAREEPILMRCSARPAEEG